MAKKDKNTDTNEPHQPRIAMIKAHKIRGMSSGSPTPSPSPDARSPRSINLKPIQRLVIKRSPVPA
jgi:hypothetical protein